VDGDGGEPSATQKRYNKMVDAFGSDSLDESAGARETFIGRIVASAVDMEDADVDIGGGSDEYESDIDLLYAIDPLAVTGDEDVSYDSTFYELGINLSSSLHSKFGVLQVYLENTTGKAVSDLSEDGIESAEDLVEWLDGRVFEFADETFTGDNVTSDVTDVTINMGRFEQMENPPNSMLVPIRHIDEDELAERGLLNEDDGEVEDVDF